MKYLTQIFQTKIEIWGSTRRRDTDRSRDPETGIGTEVAVWRGGETGRGPDPGPTRGKNRRRETKIMRGTGRDLTPAHVTDTRRARRNHLVDIPRVNLELALTLTPSAPMTPQYFLQSWS